MNTLRKLSLPLTILGFSLLCLIQIVCGASDSGSSGAPAKTGSMENDLKEGAASVWNNSTRVVIGSQPSGSQAGQPARRVSFELMPGEEL